MRRSPPSVPHLPRSRRIDRALSELLRADVARVESVLWIPPVLTELGAVYSLLLLYGVHAPGWTAFFAFRLGWLVALFSRLLAVGERARRFARLTAAVWLLSGVAAYLYDPYSRMAEELIGRVVLLLITWRHGLRLRGPA